MLIWSGRLPGELVEQNCDEFQVRLRRFWWMMRWQGRFILSGQSGWNKKRQKKRILMWLWMCRRMFIIQRRFLSLDLCVSCRSRIVGWRWRQEMRFQRLLDLFMAWECQWSDKMTIIWRLHTWNKLEINTSSTFAFILTSNLSTLPSSTGFAD